MLVSMMPFEDNPSRLASCEADFKLVSVKPHSGIYFLSLLKGNLPWLLGARLAALTSWKFPFMGFVGQGDEHQLVLLVPPSLPWPLFHVPDLGEDQNLTPNLDETRVRVLPPKLSNCRHFEVGLKEGAGRCYTLGSLSVLFMPKATCLTQPGPPGAWPLGTPSQRRSWACGG